MDYELRRATPADAQGIFETQVDAFGIADNPLRLERARASSFGRPQAHIVMVDETGRVVGVVHIGDEWINVGRCAVLKGDVGHVSIRTELQGLGLGTRMMRWTVAHLRAHGYHLSRLGGLVRFYSRFGYEPFPRRFVEMNLSGVHGVRRRISTVEAYPEPDGLFPGTIRPYDDARDFQARVRLRYGLYGARSGAWRVPAEAESPAHPAAPDPEALAWLYERDGAVRAYLLAVESPLEARGEETVFSITDFAYDQAYPDAAAAVVRKLLAHVAPHEPGRITSRLPFDEMLAEALQLGGVYFERKETYQAVASNMIMVVNLAATLRQVVPELTVRLANSLVAGWEGAIEVAIPARGACPGGDPTTVTAGEALQGEAVRLVIAGGEVTVAEEPGPVDLALQMTQAQFVKALFGIAALSELAPARTIELTPTQRALLDALFPRTQTGCGPWG
ncbi:MAG: GNAT family N-acetyltransferase [Armatimonadota bacterium]